MRIIDFNFKETKGNYVDRFEASTQLLEAAFQAANHICGEDEKKSTGDRAILANKIIRDALEIGKERLKRLPLSAV